MSSSAYNTILMLNTGVIWMNRLAAPIHIGLGTFGNVFNIIIFTRRTLRTNPCAMYFLAGSIDNLCVIYTSFLARFLATGWNIDASTSNDVLCKLRYFFSYPTVDLVLWFVVLASVDRFLSSSKSARLRQWSCVSSARKAIVGIVLFMFVIHVHIFIFYGITPTGCDYTSVQYALFFGFFYVLFGSFLPIVLMATFGILTIRNAYSIRRRIGGPPADHQRTEGLRSNDRQLLVMLLFQLVTCIVISAPFGIMNLYLVTITYLGSARPSAVELVTLNFIYNLVRVIYYFNPVVGFYIYTLTGSKFRAEFKRCIRSGVKTLLAITGLTQLLPIGDEGTGVHHQSLTGTRGKHTADGSHQQPAIVVIT